jgi:predicted TIM-barrel fold metal-dependent hydrolase
MSHTHSHPHPHSRNRRRQFLKKSVLALPAAFAAVTEPHAGAQKQQSTKQPPKGKTESPGWPLIFDAHLHCPAESGELWQWHPVTRTFEEFVAYLDRTGVGRGIINSQRCQHNGTPAEFIAGNREVARYVEKYKGRFLGACVVNPLFIDEALKEMETCRKQFGFVWVGELCNYMKPSYQYTIKDFELLVKQTVQLGMVLDVHTELEEMEHIARSYPQATIVFPHFGDDHEYDHIFKRIDLVAQNPNCYLDTSGYGHDRMGMLEYAVKNIGADRVLFGSDFSINDPGTVIARVHNAFLTEEQKRKILSGTVQQLLKKAGAHDI